LYILFEVKKVSVSKSILHTGSKPTELSVVTRVVANGQGNHCARALWLNVVLLVPCPPPTFWLKECLLIKNISQYQVL